MSVSACTGAGAPKMWVAITAPAPFASTRASASPGSSCNVHGSHSANTGV